MPSGASLIDPWSAWSRLFTTGLDLQALWWRGFETARASQAVIAARSGMIGDAIRSPHNADFAELSRLVPEKVDAFSRSLLAATSGTFALQRAWSLQMLTVSRAMIAGRMPTLFEATTLGRQALTTASAGTMLGASALAPIHRKVTANARRLGRAKPRTGQL